MRFRRGSLHEFSNSVTDEIEEALNRMHRQTMGREDAVHGVREIVDGVEQCSVQIEYDGAGWGVAAAHLIWE